MTDRTTVRLPDELIERAKRKAMSEGRSLTSLIEDGLRLIVAQPQLSSEAPRVFPRVSTATGGLMPGIDLADTAALQEMDDLDTAARLA